MQQSSFPEDEAARYQDLGDPTSVRSW